MEPGWKAESYHRISSPQQAWGERVLARIPLRGDETVLDAGCGTGRLAARLAERLPRGHVIALDGSADMLAVARRELAPFGDRVSFVHADLAALTLDAVCDVVFSNATFHWIADHDALFDGLRRALRPSGVLEAQCGGEGNLAGILARADALMTRPEFAPYFDGWHEPTHFADTASTEARLARAGFESIRVSTELAPTPFDSAEAYATFTRDVVLRHHMARLPEALRAAFLDRITEHAATDTPPFTLDYVRLNLRATAGGVASPPHSVRSGGRPAG